MLTPDECRDVADLIERQPFDPMHGADYWRSIVAKLRAERPEQAQESLAWRVEGQALLTLIGKLISDPMWADHAEISKALLKRIHAALRALTGDTK